MSSENPSLSEKAYQILLKRIVTVQYMPGAVLNEAGLVGELGISRTPIHAACIQLNKENLVDFLPKKGIRVTPISADMIRDLFDIRGLIEPYALGKYGSQLDKQYILDYLRILEDPATPRSVLYENDVKFHMEIVKQTNNRFLYSYYATLQNQMERISNLCAISEKDRITYSNEEHRNILLAILNDDFDEAVRMLNLHLKKSRETSYRVIVLSHIAQE